MLSLLFRLAWRNCFRNRRRSLLVISTLIMGTSALLIFYGFNHGLLNSYRAATIRSRAAHGQFFTKDYYTEVYEKPSEHWLQQPEEIIKTLHETRGVLDVFPRIQFFALLSNGNINLSGRGIGVDGVREEKFFTYLNVEQGKNLSDEVDGVVMGIGLARSLKLKVGDRLTVLATTVNGQLNGVDLTVTGIYHTGTKDFDDSTFRIQLKQAQFLLDTPKVESIAIGLDETRPWNEINTEIMGKFPTIEGIPFEVLDKVYYTNSKNWLDQQFQVIKVIILSIILLGILSTVSNTIFERQREIGNLRANGESPQQVLNLFLVESMLLGAVGAIAGIVVSLFLVATVLRQGVPMPPGPGLTREFMIQLEIAPKHMIETFVLALVATVIATCLAGWSTVRKPIANLLRS